MSAFTAERELVATACRVLAEAGLVELYTGHVSCRVDGDRVLVPRHRHAAGRGLESVSADDIVAVTPDGEPLEEGEPPSEFPIHAGVLAARADVTSVIHAHPLVATGLATAEVPVRAASLDAAFFGGEVPVHDPGPTLLHDSTAGAALADTLDGRHATLIRGHGAVTVGPSVPAATTRMWLLERAARLQLIGSLVGEVRPFEMDDGGFLSGSGEGFLEEAFEFLIRHHGLVPGSAD